MSEPRKWYKPKDFVKFKEDVNNFGGQKKVSIATGITTNQIYRYVTEGSAMITENAIKIAGALNVKLEDYFELVNVKEGVKYVVESKNERDKTDMIVSEEIICGLKRKIEDRLLVSHSEIYVKEIMKVVDQLVIESSYLGVHCKENGKEKFILNAIAKRRNEKI